MDCVRAVSRGPEHTCALRTDGTVWCWGVSPEAPMGSPVPVRDDWRWRG
ncbi:MAG: hypothetical protein EPO40_16090 [Myxococcaceae bacterium]|nr:MAG: hypothetical protein EPO40_16090 [Myxococcaceae bacterium]